MNCLCSRKSMVFFAVGGFSVAAMAQGSMQLYGIVDAAVRSTSHHGKTQMVGGGMSQSRWGINVAEDLGGGMSAIANLENRFLADSGSVASANHFQHSWVGLRSKRFGQLTLGRQWSTFFDVVASTYPSFPYSPYMEVYKPEIGVSMGGRNSNMLKYVIDQGVFRAGFQHAFGENRGDSQATGGYLRYSADGVSLGGGYLHTKMPGGTRFDAYTFGASYRNGAWYLSAGYGVNKRKNDFGVSPSGVSDAAVIAAYWVAEINGGFQAGDARRRELMQLGVGYQVTPRLNLGAHYYHARQSESMTKSYNNKADFVVAVADYALSKRTDIYVGVDRTRITGGNGAYIEKATDGSAVRDRAGVTIGLRHRF